LSSIIFVLCRKFTLSNYEDFKLADEAMAAQLGTDKFKRPKGWTWHHTEDGTTMQLVPSNLHNNVPHSGGVSLAKDPGY
jgi:hypothetical protein